MGTNFSQETAQTKFDEYTYRIEALCNRIEELKAQIEVSQIFKQNGQRKIIRFVQEVRT